MGKGRSESNRRIIASIAWFGAFLLTIYIYWLAMTNFVIRDFWDPLYRKKFELLKAQMTEHPARPLWLIMGSSHVHDAIAPELLAERITDGKSPILFNFGAPGASPFYQSIWLRRVLKEGIKPARVGIEMSVLFNDEYSIFVSNPALVPRARKDELDEYYSQSRDPAELRGIWLQSRWNPLFEYGMKAPDQALLWRLLPPLARFEKQKDSKWGWNEAAFKHPSREVFDAALQKKATAEGFRHATIMPNVDHALRDLIAFCRQERIEPFILWMPESEGFRALSSPQTEAGIQNYLGQIEREYGLLLIDARTWVPDEDFFDPDHVNSTGAAVFTRKLEKVLCAEGRE